MKFLVFHGWWWTVPCRVVASPHRMDSVCLARWMKEEQRTFGSNAKWVARGSKVVESAAFMKQFFLWFLASHENGRVTKILCGERTPNYDIANVSVAFSNGSYGLDVMNENVHDMAIFPFRRNLMISTFQWAFFTRHTNTRTHIFHPHSRPPHIQYFRN